MPGLMSGNDARGDELRAALVDGQEPSTGPIHLASPDPTWPHQYAAVASGIWAALGPVAAFVEHVGSTSVPGLAAKPASSTSSFSCPIRRTRPPTSPRSRWPASCCTSVSPSGTNTACSGLMIPEVNLHVFAVGSQEAERMLLFRNRLRSHDEERGRYEETKPANWPPGTGTGSRTTLTPNPTQSRRSSPWRAQPGPRPTIRRRTRKAPRSATVHLPAYFPQPVGALDGR